MASTNKTEHLGLNAWLSTDKPKREDFVRDNQLIDGAVSTVSQGSFPNLNTADGTLLKWDDENKQLVEAVEGEDYSNILTETGRWIPQIKGSTTAGSPTYIAQDGEYYRFGNICICRASVVMSNKGGMAGSVMITGIPFINSIGPISFALINCSAINLSAGRILKGGILYSNYITLVSASNGGDTILQATEIHDTFRFWHFSFMYSCI